MAQELCPNVEIIQFASDFASAYKQVAGDPARAGLAVICQWSPKWRRPVFFVGRTQFFGGKSCPVNFARVPDYWCHVMASLGAMGMGHCVDDMLVAERASTICSGYSLWRGAVALAGWDVPDKKSPPPTSSSQILPHNTPQIRVTEARVKRLQAQLNEVLQKEKLGSGLAGKLWGRLQFASTQSTAGSTKADDMPQPAAEIFTWWIRHLPVLPARPVRINMVKRLVMISYRRGLVRASGHCALGSRAEDGPSWSGKNP